MSLRIYESDYPTPFLPQMSVFQYLLPDAPGLSLGAGLHQLGVKRGSTACIWGYNSIEWVLAAYGSIAGGVTVSPANYA
jgi:hypothetical protein